MQLFAVSGGGAAFGLAVQADLCRLERTGEVTAETVAELNAIIAVMSDTGILGSYEVGQLMFAAEVLTGGSLEETASQLFCAAQVLPDAAEQLENAATRITDHL